MGFYDLDNQMSTFLRQKVTNIHTDLLRFYTWFLTTCKRDVRISINYDIFRQHQVSSMS